MLETDPAQIPRLSHPDQFVQGEFSDLRPEMLRDDAGFERPVFTFGDVKLVLVGREEQPQIPGFENARVAGASERPKFNEQYLASGDDPKKLIVMQTPLGVVEAAEQLGIQTEQMAALKQELQSGKYSATTLDLLDDIMACRLVSSEGKLSERANLDAEVLVLHALQGDQEAVAEVARRRSVVDRLDEATRAARGTLTAGEGRDWGKSEVLDPDKILLVRRTNIKPFIEQNGSVLLRSLADVSGGAYVRSSIHFSLDEPVVSHMYGQWDGVKYTIVDSLGSVMAERKRPPSSLASNDTWFEQNPGEALVLPTAKVFEADENHTGKPTENGNIIVYNPHTDRIEDLVAQERARRDIEGPGPGTTEHGWAITSPKRAGLNALTDAMQVSQGVHMHTPEVLLEARLAAELAQADNEADPQQRLEKLEHGTLRINWRRLSNDYAFVDEQGEPCSRSQVVVKRGILPSWLDYGEISQGGYLSLNQILAQCSAEARRNFYASGLSIPRATVVQGKRQDDDLDSIG